MNAISRALSFRIKHAGLQYLKAASIIIALCSVLYLFFKQDMTISTHVGVSGVEINSIKGEMPVLTFLLMSLMALIVSGAIAVIIATCSNISHSFTFITRLGISKRNAMIVNIISTIIGIACFSVFSGIGTSIVVNRIESIMASTDTYSNFDPSGGMSLSFLIVTALMLILGLVTTFTYLALLVRVFGWKSIFILIGLIILYNLFFESSALAPFNLLFGTKTLTTISFVVSQIVAYLVMTNIDDK